MSGISYSNPWIKNIHIIWYYRKVNIIHERPHSRDHVVFSVQESGNEKVIEKTDSREI